MTADADRDEQRAGRIEGGIDAIVIGATPDGLAAAAYLGKSGRRTVLLEASAEIGGPVRAREIVDGVMGVDGEHLITILDPDVVADLDLYRFGVDYAARKLDTTYFFDNGETLRFDGDLQRAATLLPDGEDADDKLNAFLRETMEAAAFLRPAFAAGINRSGDLARESGLERALAAAPPEMSSRIVRYAVASIDEMLDKSLPDGLVKACLTCEAAFLSAAAPHEAFSFMNYIRRLSGEAAGLQGAAAYPVGGVAAVVDALRRAAQSAKVEIRAAVPARSILIEWDRVAGVVLANGGQLRAPIVIMALDAARAFLDMVGPTLLDVEFQRLLTAPRSQLASAHLQMILKGVAKDEATKENMARRLVFAPSPDALRRAFVDARAGRAPQSLIVEAIFPGALDPAAALGNRQFLSAIAHPLPFDDLPDGKRRNEIRKAVIANMEKFAPGIENRIISAELRLPFDLAKATGAKSEAYAAKPTVMESWALAGVTASASNIGGLYFCGPEAQIGVGISCAAGRVAAKAALSEVQKGAGSA